MQGVLVGPIQPLARKLWCSDRTSGAWVSGQHSLQASKDGDTDQRREGTHGRRRPPGEGALEEGPH